jgi:hypothetical protein
MVEELEARQARALPQSCVAVYDLREMSGSSPMPDRLLALDVEGASAWLLGQLAGAPPNERGQNFIYFRLDEWFSGTGGFGAVQVRPTGFPLVDTAKRDQVKRLLEDAFGLLMARNLIVSDPSAGSTFCRLTASGEQQAARAAEPDQQRIAFAVNALTVGLHPALQAINVETHFRQGKFETALRDSATYLEGAIRTLSGLPSTTLGVTLADQAFARHGPLADPIDHSGQQTGLQNLYKGFFGAVRNLLAHNNHRYTDAKLGRRGRRGRYDDHAMAAAAAESYQAKVEMAEINGEEFDEDEV